VSNPAEHGAARGNPPLFDPKRANRGTESRSALQLAAGGAMYGLSSCCRFVSAVTVPMSPVYGWAIGSACDRGASSQGATGA
jgi:hypothetical protein